MAEKLISCGRYKNKTFEYVYTTDKDYCYNVCNNSQNYRGDLSEFKKYLSEKFENLTISTSSDTDQKNIIRAVFGRSFTMGFNQGHIKELNRLIPNDSNITVHTVTVKSEKAKTSSTLGIFYRLFTKKLLYGMIKKANICYHSPLLMSLNIFPVPLQFNSDNNGSVTAEDDKTSEVIKALQSDQSALMEIQQCISTYKFDISNVLADVAHMLTMINRFDGKDRIVVDDVTKSLLDTDFFINSRSEYLTVFNQHFLFYQMCKDSFLNFLKYRDRPFSFIVVEPDQFLQRMDALYNYRMYVTHTENIMELVEVIFKLAAFVNNQLYPHEIDNSAIEDVDFSSLRNIIQYVENLGSPENFVVNPSISLLNYIERQTSDDFADEELLNIVNMNPNNINSKMLENFVVDKCFLKCSNTLYSNGSLIEFHYSNKSKREIRDFYRLILCASLLSLPCTKLIICNLRLGEETRVEIDEDKEPVRNFIRKFRHPDAWKDVPILGDLV